VSATKRTPPTVDAYIAACPPEVQPLLHQLRATIRAAAPEAKELISYRMPAFKLHGYLVFFAAWKRHIGLYGNITAALEIFKDELAPYIGPKGALLLPYTRPLPFELIGRLVRLRVQEDREHAQRRAGS
jgi:uncharacterized protein YdhG (YjbR/CyaY superfamily)